MALNNSLKDALAICLFHKQDEVLCSESHALVLEHFSRSEGRIQKQFNVCAELLLAHVRDDFGRALEQVLFHEVVVFEVVHVGQVAQTFQV